MPLNFGIKNNSVLTELQFKILSQLQSEPMISKHFYLTGGTALSAFYLSHRFSDDLDFFTHDQSLENIPKIFASFCESLELSCKTVDVSPTFQRFLVEKLLKIDFVRDVPFRVGTPLLTDEGIFIDTLANIATNKITAILGRLDPKDYVDLYFILNEAGFKLDSLFEGAKKKDAGFELFTWASLLGDVETFQVLPRMIKPLRLDQLKRFFLALRKKLVLSLKP